MTEQPEPISPDDIDELDENFILGETAQELILDSSVQHIRLLDHMASQANRSIRIFTRELDPVVYDRLEFIEACKSLALRSQYARIEILAFDSQRMIQHGHRIVELARSLSSRIEIRRPAKEYERHVHSFITFDETGYIYRTYADRYEGLANYNNPRETREFEKLFAEIWQRSHVDSGMKRLNI